MCSAKATQTLSLSHPLSSLAVYLDSEGLMRVGGRLQKAGLASYVTHPILLSVQSHITRLLVRTTHALTLHAGSTTVMSILAQTYHIPQLKRLLKKLSRECVTCQKHTPELLNK